MDDKSLPQPLSIGGGILSGAETLSPLLIKYRPQTQATQATVKLILAILAKKMGDVPQEYVLSAADVTLESLKDENNTDFEKKEEIDLILGVVLSAKEFNELVDLGKKITDYVWLEEDEAIKP